MESIFRLIKGYLIIRISKQGFVRFLNLCLQNNIYIWDILEQEKEILISVTLHDFLKIQDIVRKSKVKIHIINRRGFPFYMVRMRRYLVLCVGILFCLFCLFYQKTHLWTIRTEGNISITSEQIEDCLKENGFYCGMRSDQFQASQTEKVLKEKFDIFSWVSTSLNGTELTVSVIENTASNDEFVQKEFPSSLYASHDGIIRKLVVNNGYTKYKINDEVKTGDLIISGEVPYSNNDGINSFHLTFAQGEYLCEVKVPFHKSYQRTQDKPIYGVWESCLGSMAWNTFFFPDVTSFKKETNCIILREYIDLNFLSLFDYKIYYIKSQQRKFKTIRRTLDEEEIKEQLTKEIRYYINDLEQSGASNIIPDVSFTANEKEISLYGIITYFTPDLIRKNITPQTDEGIGHGTDNTYNGT